tara:strand:- start:23368 stop:24183 length:816 start_codon:yes stop_codon:yes gene_type:complete
MKNNIDIINYFNILNISYTNDIDYIKKTYRNMSIKIYNNKNKLDELNNAYLKITDYLKINKILNNDNIDTNVTNNTNDKNNTNNTNNINNIETLKIIKEDINTELIITFEQSFNGSTLPIFINRKKIINFNSMIENERIYVDIPPGIDNNEIIIINNKGNCYDGYFTDLKILIVLENHKLFTRNGLDLIFKMNITFKESITGFERELTHINSKKYKIKNKVGEIISPVSEKKIEKLGFIRNDYKGDMIIKFNIDYPIKLNTDIINQLKKIL